MASKNKKSSKLMGFAFIIFGLALMIGSPIYISSLRAEQAKCTETAEAVIIKYDEREVSSRTKVGNSYHTKVETEYTPVYEFAAEGGTFTGSGTASTSKPYSIGDKVQIHYEPNSPDNNYLDPISPVMVFVGAGSGVVFALIGILVFTEVLSGKKQQTA